MFTTLIVVGKHRTETIAGYQLGEAEALALTDHNEEAAHLLVSGCAPSSRPAKIRRGCRS